MILVCPLVTIRFQIFDCGVTIECRGFVRSNIFEKEFIIKFSNVFLEHFEFYQAVITKVDLKTHC